MNIQQLYFIAYNSITSSSGNSGDKDELKEFIIHHVTNSKEWHPFPKVGIHFPEKLITGGIDLGPSLHSIMLIIASAILFFLFGILYKKQSRKAPHGITNMLESMILFVRNAIRLLRLHYMFDLVH